jgi:hypothetical protein
VNLHKTIRQKSPPKSPDAAALARRRQISASRAPSKMSAAKLTENQTAKNLRLPI